MNAEQSPRPLALDVAAAAPNAEPVAERSACSLEWVNDFVGVPFRANGRDRAGWDCWGLALAVYRERLGLELPDWRWCEPYSLSDKLRAFAEALDAVELEAAARELEGPEAWALALISHDRRAHHVGVAIAGAAGTFGVLHAQRYCGTVFEPIARFAVVNRGAKWFRWRR